MSDKSRADKIAAAKKKLKDFQSKQKQDGPAETTASIFGAATPADASGMTAGTTMPKPQNVTNEVPVLFNADLLGQSNNDPFALNHFNTGNQQAQSTISFFDTIPSQPSEPSPKQPTNQSKHCDASLFRLGSDMRDLHKLSEQLSSALENNNYMEPAEPEGSPNSEEQTQSESLLYGQSNDTPENCDTLDNTISINNFMFPKIDSDIKQQESIEDNSELITLRNQLSTHINTIGLLVSEKADLSGQLKKYQEIAKEKSDTVISLQNEISSLHNTIKDLEIEINSKTCGQSALSEYNHRLCNDIKEKDKELFTLRSSNEEFADQIGVLKQQQINQLSKIESLEKELEICKLRAEQLSSGNQVICSEEHAIIEKTKELYEKRIEEVQMYLDLANKEKTDVVDQYENYMKSLNTENQTQREKIQSLSTCNDELQQRVSSLIKHIGDLEKQIQQQMGKQKQFANNSESTKDLEDALFKANNKIRELEDNIKSIQSVSTNGEELLRINAEQQKLIEELNEKILVIENDKPDSKALIAAIESDKVAASRAMEQNQQLKEQIQEYQNAIMQLNQDKLELTDKFLSEQHLNKETKSMSHMVEELEQKLHYKDEEMIRLAHENTELNKKILEQSQRLDTVDHYDAAGVVDESTKYKISQLQAQNEKLKAYVTDLEGRLNTSDTIVSTSSDEYTTWASEKEHLLHEIELLKYKLSRNGNNNVNGGADNCDSHDNSDTVSISSTINVSANEAMQKLQERFKRTMTEIADLTEEKHRLEHLVLQLQGETETIGEYITLYQNQRRQLKQREREKDEQLRLIMHDREEMQTKLHQLNSLVNNLIQQQGQKSIPVTENNKLTTTNGSNVHPIIKPTAEIVKSVNQTSEEIFHLLDELKKKNVQDLNSRMSRVHHCACCSGQLETV